MTTAEQKTEQKTVNLKEKLSSRKFWAAVLAAAGALICAIIGDSLTAETVASLRCGVSALIAYIFGEGAVDLARILTAKE